MKLVLKWKQLSYLKNNLTLVNKLAINSKRNYLPNVVEYIKLR